MIQFAIQLRQQLPVRLNNGRWKCLVAAFLISLFSAAGGVEAAPITAPTDLNPGDKYRLVFVTSTLIDAMSTDIADYNNFVTGVANGVPELAALGTTWNVIGSTASVDARDNTGTNPFFTGVPIYRLDDTRIANNNADLWDGTIQDDLGVDQNGVATDSVIVWAGTRLDGTAFEPFELGASDVSLGWLDLANQIPWMEFGVHDPSEFLPVFAMSGEITVVPVPSTMILVCFGASGVVAWPRRRRRH